MHFTFFFEFTNAWSDITCNGFDVVYKGLFGKLHLHNKFTIYFGEVLTIHEKEYRELIFRDMIVVGRGVIVSNRYKSDKIEIDFSLRESYRGEGIGYSAITATVNFLPHLINHKNLSSNYLNVNGKII